MCLKQFSFFSVEREKNNAIPKKAGIPASAAAKEKPSTKSRSAGGKKNKLRQAPGHGER